MTTRNLPKRLIALLTATTATAALGASAATAAGAPGCDRATGDLQRRLVALHYVLGRADGCNGPATLAAIQAFQRAQGLPADGIAGPATRRALRSPKRPVARSRAPGEQIEIRRTRQLLLRVRDGNRRILAQQVAPVYAAGRTTVRIPLTATGRRILRRGPLRVLVGHDFRDVLTGRDGGVVRTRLR